MTHTLSPGGYRSGEVDLLPGRRDVDMPFRESREDIRDCYHKSLGERHGTRTLAINEIFILLGIGNEACSTSVPKLQCLPTPNASHKL
jgi:hypothetical protein